MTEDRGVSVVGASFVSSHFLCLSRSEKILSNIFSSRTVKKRKQKSRCSSDSTVFDRRCVGVFFHELLALSNESTVYRAKELVSTRPEGISSVCTSIAKKRVEQCSWNLAEPANCLVIWRRDFYFFQFTSISRWWLVISKRIVLLKGRSIRMFKFPRFVVRWHFGREFSGLRRIRLYSTYSRADWLDVATN